VVLLHGLASNARIWDFVAPLLVQAGFRVLALDQRHHGRSDDAEDGFDFPSIVRDLHVFVDTLQLDKPLLVGHSWGAGTVLNYAAARPAGPSGIVLVDGGTSELSAIPGMTWEQAEQMLRPPDLDGMPREDLISRLRGWTRDFYRAEIEEMVLAGFVIQADDTLRRKLPIPKHMRIARAIYEQKTAELFARVRCPILLCPSVAPEPHDERTEQFLAQKREGVARAEQANPLTRTLWFENTVHDSPLQRPAELAQAIADFGLKLGDH
jgi:pimeloyl-ACP methyl ester carboxylesterase